VVTSSSSRLPSMLPDGNVLARTGCSSNGRQKTRVERCETECRLHRVKGPDRDEIWITEVRLGDQCEVNVIAPVPFRSFQSVGASSTET
jgi:hypothetical protein